MDHTTIAETAEYIRTASRLLTDSERQDVLTYLAAHPKAGDLIEGMGGVRVIYYFRSEAVPLCLLTLFGKGERANINQAERNELRGLVKLIVETWKENVNECCFQQYQSGIERSACTCPRQAHADA